MFSNEEWEAVIVLDSCRYDFFKEFYKYFPNLSDGNLSKRRVEASCTPEFVERYFDDEDFTMVTANPYVSNYSEKFEGVQDLWSSNWDEELNTVMPEVFLKYLRRNSAENKVFWMMQPHNPYVGSIKYASTGGFFSNTLPFGGIVNNGAEPSGSVDRQRLKNCYKFNLIRALYCVDRMMKYVDGKVIITSDHGEMLLDDEEHVAHPKGVEEDVLREVPYLEIDASKTDFDTDELSVEEFVISGYESVLNRPPEDEGLDNYISQIKKGLSRREFLEILMHSEENINKNPGIISICRDNYENGEST